MFTNCYENASAVQVRFLGPGGVVMQEIPYCAAAPKLGQIPQNAPQGVLKIRFKNRFFKNFENLAEQPQEGTLIKAHAKGHLQQQAGSQIVSNHVSGAQIGPS